MPKKIEFQVGFNVDKKDINELQQLLKSIQTEAAKDTGTGKYSDDLQKAALHAEKLSIMLNKAWNVKLNQLDLSKFNQSVTTTYGSVEQLKKSLESVGRGDIFNKIQSSVLNTNLQLKQTNKLLDNMAVTMANTVRYGIASSVFNRISNEIQNAYNYSVKLDTSLNDIRIVTDKSAEDMTKFAVQANKAAKALGSSTLDYTKASTIYYQQGLSDEETAARTDVTLKAANVTGQTGEEVSEQLTAIWNGYKVSAEESELYIDKVAKVAASTAADLEEMATGMSKVASAANSAGVDIDHLNGMLATVISVTREAPETIGSSFKTIFARLGDLSLGKTDEEGVGLGKVSGQLHNLGIELLDETGNMRDLGVVIEDIAAKWQTWTQAQRQAAAVAMAGKMQYSRLIALFDNWDMYNEAFNESVNAVGTLNEQQNIYMESTEAHLQQLRTEAERTYDILFDQDAVNSFADSLNGALTIFNNFLETTGGGISSLIALGSTLGNVFSQQIGAGIGQMVQNHMVGQLNARNTQAAQDFAAVQSSNQGLSEQEVQAYKEIHQYSEQLLGMSQNLTSEQYNRLNALKEQAEQDKLHLASLEAQNLKQESLVDIEAQLANQNDIIKQQRKNYADIKKEIEIIERIRSSSMQLEEDVTDSLIAQGTVLERIEVLAKENLLNESQSKLYTDAIIKDDKNILLTTQELNDLDKIASDILTEKVAKQKELVRSKELQAQIDQGELDNARNKAGQSEDTLKTALTAQERQNAISSAIQGITAIISLTTQLTGIVKTLNDDSLSGWEKFERVGSTLLMTLPMLITNFTAIKTVIPSLITGFTGMSVSEFIAAQGAKTLGGAIWAALAPILPIILAVAAAVGVLTVGIIALVKAYDADKNAAEAAAEAAKQAKQEFNEAAEAAKALRTEISDYTEALKGLNNLTEGTQEYKKALEDTNEKAQELIKTLGLYDDYRYENGIIKINEKALEEAQAKADKAAAYAEKNYYTKTITANEKQLSYQQQQVQRSVGNVLTTHKDGTQLKGTSYSAIEGTQLSKETIASISKALSDLKSEDINKYNQTVANDTNFKDFVSGIDQSNEAIQAMLDPIARQKSSFIDLANTTDELTAVNKRAISSINLVDVKERYSGRINDLAGYDTKTGEVNQQRANQIAKLINESDIQKRVQEQKEARREEVANWDFNRRGEKYTDSKAWAREFSTDNKNTDVTNVLKQIGVTNEELTKMIGTTNLKEDRELAQAYAKLKNIDLTNALYADGKYTDNEGKVLIDVSSAEKRGAVRENIFSTVQTAHDDEFYDSLGERQTNQTLDKLDSLLSGAKEAGAKYGADFSQSMLDYLSNNGDKFNLAELGASLDPSELEAMKQMTPQEIAQMFGMTDEALQEFGVGTAEEAAKKFQEALANVEWDPNKAIANIVNGNKETIEGYGLKTDELAEYSEYLMEVAHGAEDAQDGINDLADGMEYNAEAAVIVAQSVMRMNNGIEKLAKGQENWLDILKKSSIESEEYYDALHDMRDAMGDLLDLSDDVAKYLDGDFFTNNADLIKQAAEGSADAIDKLRDAAADSIILSIAIENGLDEAAIADVQNKVNELQSLAEDIVVGTELNLDGMDAGEAEFLNKCQEIINTAGMTAEQASAMFSAMGFETNFATKEEDVEQTSPNTVTETTVKGYTSGTAKGPDGEDRNWEYPILSTSTYQDGTSTHTGKMTVMAMATSPDGSKVPVINSMTKKATGKSNNYSKKNTGGAKSPTSGKKSGGGGGGSQKDPKKLDPMEEHADRYHQIDAQIKLVETALSRLEKQQKKTFGKDYLTNLNKQYAQLQKQVDNYNKKIKIAQGEQDELRKKLAGQGVKFNGDGTISNYMDAFAAQQQKVNDLIKEYNSLSAEQQEQWDKDKKVDKAKEEFNKFKENLDRYDTLVTDFIPGLQDSIQDAVDKQIEINIQKFNYEIDLRLNMKEAERDWNNFRKKVINQIRDDDILGNLRANFKQYSDYFEGAAGNIIGQETAHLKDLIGQINQINSGGWSSAYGDNKAQALEDLKKYLDELTSNMENMQDLTEEIRQAYLDMLDEAADKFEEQIDLYGQIDKMIEHDMKAIELIRGETAYKEMDKYLQKQKDNNKQQLVFNKQQEEFWKQRVADTKKMADNALTERNRYKQGTTEWDQLDRKYRDMMDRYDAAVEHYQDSLEATAEQLEKSLEDAAKTFENSLNIIFQELNNKVTNGMGLEYVSEEWRLINENADQYLDTINSLYGIQKIENKYLDAIDQTDNVSAQRKLKDLMQEEVKALQEKDKLTQYDIERAEMKYQIALKQIALEEAQQNKSSMRLRRDSQGNYSYQFVADNDNVAQTQEELSDLYNQLYNFDLEHYRSNLDKLYDVWEEFQEKIAEAAKINDPEERAARELLLREQYGQLINGLVEQNETLRLNLEESGFKELADLRKVDVDDFRGMSADERDILMGEMVPQWESGVQQMADKFAGEGGFEQTVSEAMDNISQTTAAYDQELLDLAEDAGKPFDELVRGIDYALPELESFLDDNEQLIKAYDDQVGAIQSVEKELDILIDKYKTAKKNAEAATEAAYKLWQEENRKAAEKAEKERQKQVAQQPQNQPKQQSQPVTTSSGGSGDSGGGDGKLSVGDTATYTGGPYFSDSYGGGPSGNRGPGKKVKITVVKTDGRPYPIHVTSNDSAYGWLKKEQLTGYATGGYTGDWGDSSGKLALLHKKEMVLNAEDTRNMLSAVEILRNVTDNIGSSLLMRMANITSGMNAPNAAAADDGILEQNVHIEATFPDVKDATEIETALRNLVNVASQRAHRVKR